MSYSLEQLSADIRQALQADPGAAGKQAVCKLVSKALLDQDFIARHLTAEQCRPRLVDAVIEALGVAGEAGVELAEGNRAGGVDAELGDLRGGDRRHGNGRLAHRQPRRG